jgi:hypothetical protein
MIVVTSMYVHICEATTCSKNFGEQIPVKTSCTSSWVATSVTRWVGEKIGRNVAQAILCQNYHITCTV